MFCTACAAHNPAQRTRCVTCGARFAPPSSDSQRESRPRLLRILAVVPLLVALVAGGFSVSAYHSQHDALSAAYARGEAAMTAGDYPAAVVAFSAAGAYRDAVSRRAAAVAALAPYRAAYLTGVNALQAGDYEHAVAALLPVARDLPDYEQVQAMLARARDLRRGQLLGDVNAAEARRDWLVAEQTLLRLLAADPSDPALQTHFADLERLHAPVVFTRDGAIYIVGPDLRDERLVIDHVSAIWPAWSPDRTRIAFFASDNAPMEHYGLYVVGLDGSGPTRLAPDVRLEGWPLWSPDGRKIAYDSRASFTLDNQEGISSLHVVDVTTGVDTDLTSTALHYTTTPTWSPDGTRLAFISKKVYQRGVAVGRRTEGQLHIVVLRTGAISDAVGDDLPYAAYVAWSPVADTLLVLSSELGSAWYETMITSIQRIDLRTGAITEITGRSKSVAYPIWSPDGSRFVFLEGADKIHIVALDGSEITYTLPRAILPFLTWSPDGSRLIAPSVAASVPSLVIDLANGGKETDFPLTFDFTDLLAGPPLWSPAYLVKPPGPPTIAGTALDP